jgi:hypothetical protein
MILQPLRMDFEILKEWIPKLLEPTKSKMQNLNI